MKPVETVIPGYVEAWRWFGINQDLNPISVNNSAHVYNWSGENVADHPPRERNSNGFYAYKPSCILDHVNGFLLGRVALYGDVVECAYGYRAEKLRILDAWVDKDLECSPETDREKFDHFMSIPQVKGVYDTFDPRVVNIFGNEGDYQCLTLETRKELSGLSLSGGRTMTMIIDNQGESRPEWTQPVNQTETPIGSLYTPTKEWVSRPKGRYCGICRERITDNQLVIVNWDLPLTGDLCALVLNHRFHWDVKWIHMECSPREYWMGVDFAYAEAAPIYATWATNVDPSAWPWTVKESFSYQIGGMTT